MADPGDKKKRATYQDVLEAPAYKVAEVLDGELHVSPRPAGPHTMVATTLGYALGPPFHHGDGGPGGWIILDEPELHLGPDGEDIVVPDLAGWRRGRLDGDALRATYFTAAPDWVCEVLSRSTQAIDRGKKLAIYAREGVRHAWLVHPFRRSIEVYRLESGRWTLVATHVGDVIVRVEPFEALALDLDRLWRDLPPRGTRASEGVDWFPFEEAL